MSTPPRRRSDVVRAGVRLAALEVGERDAPALLVAHGAGSSAAFIERAFAGPVHDAGWRLVTFDLRGHGASDPARSRADHHLDVHAADLAAVAAEVPGGVAVVGGVSLGGHAAVRAATRHALRSSAVLACLPAWTGTAARGHGPHAVVAAELAQVGVAGVLARLRADATLPGWLRATLVTDYARHDPPSLCAALTALDGGEAPSEEELGALSVPLVVVAWDHDPGHPLAVARTWTRAASRSHLTRIGLGDLEVGVDRLGAAGLAALDRVGIRGIA